MEYVAEINGGNEVQRVIIAPDVDWAIDTLGGTWFPTIDPFNPDPEAKTRYTGKTDKFDRGLVERFINDIWTVEKGTIPDSEGNYFYNTEGQITWHNGRGWRNLLPSGTPNVWEPGVANWREYPIGDKFPIWIQPTGAFDAYDKKFIVEHVDKTWISLVAANVWEPGTDDSLWAEYTGP